MAPMSLVTYEDVRPWARAIRERVLTRQMPPCRLSMLLDERARESHRRTRPLRLFDSHLESSNIRRNFRTILYDPDFVDPRRENQGIDIVHNLAAIIGEHRQDRELRAVGSAQVRSHVNFRRESGTAHDDVAGVENFFRRDRNFGFGLSTCCCEKGSQNDK